MSLWSGITNFNLGISMISSIRKGFKKKEYQVAVLILVFSFGFLITIGEMFKKFTGGSDWAISIDNYKISKEQFTRKVEEEKIIIDSFKKQFGNQAGAFLGSMNVDPKELAIKALINEALLSQLAKNLNIHLSPEFVAQELAKQGANLQILSELLNYSSVHDLENDIKNNLKNGITLELAQAAFYAPGFYIKNRYVEEFLKKKFTVLVFPYDKYLEAVKKMPLTDLELEKFYKEITERDKSYWVPEKREGIKYDFFKTAYSINVQDKELEDYYNKNKNLFMQKPAQVKVRRILLKDPEQAEKIRSELVAEPKKFSEYAKQFSQDAETANQGGLIDFFIKGEKDPVFEEEAFALSKDDEISNVIQTADGLEILQRVSKKPIEFKKFETVKDQIKEILQKEKFGNIFKLDVKKFIDTSSLDEKAFDEFLKKRGAVQKKIDTSTTDSSKLAKKLFEINTEGKIKLMYDDNSASLIRLTKIQKGYLPELKSVKEKISLLLYEQKAKKKLQEDLNRAKKELGTTSFEKLKSDLGLKLIDTPWIGPKTTNTELEDVPVAELVKITKENHISDYLGIKNGYLIKLIAVEPFNPANFNEKKGSIEDNLYKQNKVEYDMGFVASLQKNAKISFNKKNIKK